MSLTVRAIMYVSQIRVGEQMLRRAVRKSVSDVSEVLTALIAQITKLYGAMFRVVIPDDGGSTHL
jgi:hypothetical protein